MIFCEIKFLICIQEIPFVRFACTVPKVSSLEIFSHKNIISHKGIINLTNEKGLYIQKHRKHYLILAFLTCYFYTICCNNVSE